MINSNVSERPEQGRIYISVYDSEQKLKGGILSSALSSSD